jgi:hypothetical protein
MCPRSERISDRERTSAVDEEALIVWQDVLDSIMAGRSNDLTCPYCGNRPLLVEQVEFSTKISCNKCRKFILLVFTVGHASRARGARPADPSSREGD